MSFFSMGIRNKIDKDSLCMTTSSKDLNNMRSEKRKGCVKASQDEEKEASTKIFEKIRTVIKTGDVLF
ncbi:hypothetical protein TN98_02900 [Pantoea anthophila]|nr:hypothetical protein TN98_02900 [Pantoea anthophila]